MLLARHFTSQVLCKLSKCFRSYHVTIVGGAGDIGQTLGLLLRPQSLITQLAIYDEKDYTSGVVLDLSHIPSASTICGYTGGNSLDQALKKTDLILATGGAVRTAEVHKDTWLTKNIDFIKYLSGSVSKLRPMPFIGIATDPINVTVPIAAELIKSQGTFDSKKLFGLTGIDSIRAQAIYAADNYMNPSQCRVPVIGGHSKNTMVPLISQVMPADEIVDRQYAHEFTERLRNCEDKIVRAKRGFPSTLSIAYAAHMFTKGILKALNGETAEVNAYVENNDFGTNFFSGLVKINQDGVVDMKRYTRLTDYEYCMLEQSIEELRNEISQGLKVLETPDASVN